jgi:hypothetical protein
LKGNKPLKDYALIITGKALYKIEEDPLFLKKVNFSAESLTISIVYLSC